MNHGSGAAVHRRIDRQSILVSGDHRASVTHSRIVCLTEETTETLYLLGEGDRVVGVSGYTVRPPEARQKPKVSRFINARFDKIEALKPDLILAFSDLQADIAPSSSDAAIRSSRSISGASPKSCR